ncbi:hypothetical protein SODALDRAFT_337455 [Sodiomyces alkalinus F11]|uniref:DUF2406 domain-containing protein n=1 Tax=Sodiomyces alkalinus (strain CBS 110278 / VKM F-3762 / F11) TaxID=1314773 RepID=A0A3N2PM27_SODAK|nr:hypothetical protein SODALDRAFT_337455 [Sodiomyces alkalinus F11]ROT35464.1 hypothetical protein SODALDRAFT_337455 [Sodiomyces alkalinus F11]
MAISEAEPAAVQAMTKSSLAPLRAIQHRDSFGNPIAEPDLSNPTRSRWERPLDTIRSFEAAIDGGYSRKSYIRPDTDAAANWNRRSSYYAGAHGSRSAHDGYYAGRPASMRPESTHLDYNYSNSNRSGQLESMNQNGGGSYGPGPSRQRTPRMLSEPARGHGDGSHHQNVYPLPHKDRSYETVTTAAGSGSSEQAGYQTDPTSSENSSIDRPSPTKRRERINDYGIGFSQPATTYQPPAFSVSSGPRAPGSNGAVPQLAPLGPNQNQSQSQNHGDTTSPPAIPRKDVGGGSSGGSILLRKPSALQRSDTTEKRKSWFSRRFSKNS